jgi:hypothetical protein
MSATNITSKCRIASIKLNGAMILAQVANPDGSNIRKGQLIAVDDNLARLHLSPVIHKAHMLSFGYP